MLGQWCHVIVGHSCRVLFCHVSGKLTIFFSNMTSCVGLQMSENVSNCSSVLHPADNTQFIRAASCRQHSVHPCCIQQTTLSSSVLHPADNTQFIRAASSRQHSVHPCCIQQTTLSSSVLHPADNTQFIRAASSRQHSVHPCCIQQTTLSSSVLHPADNTQLLTSDGSFSIVTTCQHH